MRVLPGISSDGKQRMAIQDKDNTCHEEKHVHQPHKASLRRRMNRTLGQAQGIANMIEEDRYCVDILVQISAVRAALNQVAMQIVEDHTKGCVQRALQEGNGDEAITELMDILQKLTK